MLWEILGIFVELRRCTGGDGSQSSFSYAIRPVVEIDFSKVIVGETGTGTSSDPYSIAAK